MTDMLARRRIRRRAGASAAAIYERRKREWHARNRGLFAVGAAIVAVIVAGTLVAAVHHVWPWAAGVIAGAAVAFYLALRDSPPPWVENYRVGAWGEERTARALEPLLRSGWTIIHDLDRIKWNLDHVLIGPAGVFVLDSKNLHGTVRIKGDTLKLTRPGNDHPDYTHDRYARSARRHGAELNALLRRRCKRSPWVTADVVIWAEFPQRAVAGNRMSYVHGDHLVGWLNGQPARLDANEVDQIAAGLAPGQRRRSPDPTSTPATP